MLKTGLEFANGTTEDCQKLVVSMFKPSELLGWYKDARRLYKSSDVVLVTDATDPSGVKAWPRAKYIEQLRVSMGRNAERLMPSLTMSTKSAHQIVRMPGDSDAFWLVIARGNQIPIMCVLFANPYEELAPDAPAPAIGEA